MSYLTVKQGLAGIMNALGFSESEQAFTFGNASAMEYQNTFIIRSTEGSINDDSPTLATRFYDNQVWDIQVAFEKSSQSDIVNLDEIHRVKDSIIAQMDDPDNWRSFVRQVKYKSWKIEEEPSFYLLTVILDVTDVFTY
jgi:hypothetical protein